MERKEIRAAKTKNSTTNPPRENNSNENIHPTEKQAAAMDTTIFSQTPNMQYLDESEATVIGGILSQPVQPTSPDMPRVVF